MEAHSHQRTAEARATHSEVPITDEFKDRETLLRWILPAKWMNYRLHARNYEEVSWYHARLVHLFSIMYGDLDDDDRLAESGVRIMRYVDQVHQGETTGVLQCIEFKDATDRACLKIGKTMLSGESLKDPNKSLNVLHATGDSIMKQVWLSRT